jgi:hypothetical protein
MNAANRGASPVANCLCAQDAAKLPRSEFLNEQGLIYGQSYRSTAIVPDGTPALVVDDPVTRYVPSAPAGRRMSGFNAAARRYRRSICSAAALSC